ncbi:hypothetical protein DPMN_036390 [Dreissena polymorpha]|uniref:Uncharacterized protein n=1 Tax=Dreissena polymorpha TaxID=45954 RepID=A0A9D4RN12_DREPO|nr:hypothetical protein DPMN_036390 [Dreissena polymorpha]
MLGTSQFSVRSYGRNQSMLFADLSLEADKDCAGICSELEVYSKSSVRPLKYLRGGRCIYRTEHFAQISYFPVTG